MEIINLMVWKNNRELFCRSDINAELNRKAVSSSVILVAAEICSSVLRVGSIAILARILMPGDFGLLAMVTAFTTFAERFKDIGLGDATVQARDLNHEQVSALFWINLSICAVIGFLIAGFSKVIAWFYQEPRLIAISVVIAATFIFSGLVIQHQALLRRRLLFGRLALINLSSVFLSIVVAIIMAYLGFGYWSLVGREFSRGLFVVVGSWASISWFPRMPKRKNGIGALLTFGKYVTGFNMAYFFSRSFDKILIGKLFGPNQLGLYTNAYQLISIPISQIQHPINTVALSSLSALQRDSVAFCSYFKKMLNAINFVCVPIIVFIAVFGDILVPFILGQKWAGAVGIFQMLAIGAFIEPNTHAIGPAMVASGKTSQYLRIGLVESSALLVCLFLGSRWGTIGVAFGYSASMYLAFLARCCLGLKHTFVNKNDVFRTMANNGCIGIIMGLILICLRYLTHWSLLPQWLLIYIPSGVFIYFLIRLLYPGGRQEMFGYWDFARKLFDTA